MKLPQGERCKLIVRISCLSLITRNIASGLAISQRLLGHITRNKSIKLMMFAILCWHSAAAGGPATAGVQPWELVRHIPPRPSSALRGSAFTDYVSNMDPQHREMAIREEILKGNLPDFLRKLVPVELRQASADGKTITATIFVMPDYLAIGSDDDYLRIPMNLYSATSIAKQFGFVLPTKKMVDAIYAQSARHLVPEPLPAGPSMRSTECYSTHNQMIERQEHRLGIQSGELVSGHKKDVVVSNRLTQKEDRIAIYGWHRHLGDPIQPLSTVHGAGYADYSHGIRLISAVAIVDGEVRSVYEVLRNPQQAGVFSSEGTMDRIFEKVLPEPATAQFTVLQQRNPR